MHSSELRKALGLGEITLPAELVLADGRFCNIRTPTFLDMLASNKALKDRADELKFLSDVGAGEASLLYLLIERVVSVEGEAITIQQFFTFDTYDIARVIAYVMASIDSKIPPKKEG